MVPEAGHVVGDPPLPDGELLLLLPGDGQHGEAEQKEGGARHGWSALELNCSTNHLLRSGADWEPEWPPRSGDKSSSNTNNWIAGYNPPAPQLFRSPHHKMILGLLIFGKIIIRALTFPI